MSGAGGCTHREDQILPRCVHANRKLRIFVHTKRTCTHRHTNTHTHTHTYTRIRTRIRTRIHTRIYTRTHTRTNTHTHTHTYTHTYSHTHTHTHTLTHTHIHTRPTGDWDVFHLVALAEAQHLCEAPGGPELLLMVSYIYRQAAQQSSRRRFGPTFSLSFCLTLPLSRSLHCSHFLSLFAPARLLTLHYSQWLY
jgi:hypothetical protein